MCGTGVQVPARGQVVLICVIPAQVSNMKAIAPVHLIENNQSPHFRRYLIINDKLYRAESLFGQPDYRIHCESILTMLFNEAVNC